MKSSSGALLAAAAGLGLAWGLSELWRRRHSFCGQAVAIAGASRGLGLAMARRLRAEGADVVLLARSADELEGAVEDLAPRGAGRLLQCVCDVTREEDVEATFDWIEQRLGRLDAVINNAGVILSAPFDEHGVEDFEEAVATHLMGPLYVTRAALPLLRRQGGGRIVNVSSIGGRVGVPHMTAYSASKFALVGFSRALAAELRREGIYVTVACPGLMRTGSHRVARFAGQVEKEFGWFTTLDSLPGLSVSADGAARRILDASRAGRAEIVFPLQWRLAAMGADIAPGLAVKANDWVNRLLPDPGSGDSEQIEGREATGERVPDAALERLEKAGASLNQPLRG